MISGKQDLINFNEVQSTAFNFLLFTLRNFMSRSENVITCDSAIVLHGINAFSYHSYGTLWCTRSFFADLSLIYEDLSNIHTAKIADYMVTEHCPINHLMQIIALLRIPPKLFRIPHPLNSKYFVTFL